MASPDSISVDLQFAAIAALTDEIFYWTCPHAGTYRIDKMYFTSMTARTADDTDYTTISVKNEGTEIATEATTTSDLGSLTAGGEVELALTGTGADLEVAQGETLAFLKTDTGSTGLALDGSFSVSLSKVRV